MCYMLFNTNQMCSTTPALLLLEHQVSCDFPFQYFGLDFPGTSWKVSLFGDILVRIQSECGKMRTRITPTTDTFYAVWSAKAYILVFTCATTWCTQLELVTDFTTETLTLAIKRFISQREKPYSFISDNFKTFILKGLKHFLLNVDISWKHILVNVNSMYIGKSIFTS